MLTTQKSILIVEDDHALAGALTRSLTQAGWSVLTAVSAEQGLAMVTGPAPLDVVVTDLQMEEMDGIRFIEELQKYRPQVPLLILTGAPSVASAIDAVRLKVFRYLLKPISVSALLAILDEACNQDARPPLPVNESQRAELGKIELQWQPLVSAARPVVMACEALVRFESRRPEGARAVFQQAERLGLVRVLGKRIRELAAEALAAQPGAIIHLNLHPEDLHDQEFLAGRSPLSPFAKQVVLELDPPENSYVRMANEAITTLREQGFSTALNRIDPEGRGLKNGTTLSPAALKLDRRLIGSIEKDAQRAQRVRDFVNWAEVTGIPVVAVGVETVAERKTLYTLGIRMMQGYLLARPSPTLRPATEPWIVN